MKKEQKEALEPKIKIHIEEEERNVFKDEHVRRHRIEKRSRNMIAMVVVMLLVFIFVCILPNGMDSNNLFISTGWWADAFRKNVSEVTSLLGGQTDSVAIFVVCRFVIVGLVGAALGISGAVYQGSLKNGLASPTTLGVQSGGVLGGTVYVMFFMTESTGIKTISEIHAELQSMNIFQRYAESFFIMAGCFVAVAFVITVSKIAGRGKISTVALILTGMVFSSVVTGTVGLVRYWLMMYDTYSTRTYEIRFMMMGTFSRTFTPEHLMMIGIPLVIGTFIIMLLRNKLNLLVFGEDEARAMGVRVDLSRNILIGIVTVMTAIIISFCGMIGFIGFIVPHMTRRITGPDFRYLLPGSAITGATSMMIVYYVATLVNYADNINFMTSIVCGTVFLIMLIMSRRRSNADWA